MKKILHITGLRELGAGQRQQLTYEANAAKKLEIQWDTIAYHSCEIKESFERPIPKALDFLLIRNLYIWIKAWQHAKEYDLILMRHIAFDPFAFLFAPLIKNRMSVHHAKEVEELLLVRQGWQGKMASWLEQYTGKCAIKHSQGVVGVTSEIAQYETQTRGLKKPRFVYQNGIDFDRQALLPDKRIENEVHIFFMCSYFSDWHGLDILLDSLNRVEEAPFYIHLVGHLTEAQKEVIKNHRHHRRIATHGLLAKDAYMDLASKCDVGLDSLALFRKGLTEASTLKVREMLAMGLAVFSAHKDASCDDDFPYYHFSKQFDFSKLLEFARLNKAVSREDIRNTSKARIDKKSIMQKFLQQLIDNNE